MKASCSVVCILLILISNDCKSSNNFDIRRSVNFDRENRKTRNEYMNEKADHPSPKVCPVSKIRRGQIIKTNDSIKAGAVFIDMPIVDTVKECHEKCCSLSHCNTAVVKVNKNRVSCYLFDCGIQSRCSFDAHKDYKVIELDHRKELSDQSPNPIHTETENVSNGGIKEKDVGKCPFGFHAVSNECREDCSNEFYFECANFDRPLFKQCIATYDRCDGYKQCDDNSDEINCSTNDDKASESMEAHTTGSKPGASSPSPAPPGSTSPAVRGSSTPKRSLSTSPTRYIELSGYSKHKLDNFKGGAVVVLALGMVLVVASLVVLCCQVQKLRKQGRNRKAKNMDGDTDYLINGLYL